MHALVRYRRSGLRYAVCACVLDTSIVLKQEVPFSENLHSLSCQAFDARLQGRSLIACEAATLGQQRIEVLLAEAEADAECAGIVALHHARKRLRSIPHAVRYTMLASAREDRHGLE